MIHEIKKGVHIVYNGKAWVDRSAGTVSKSSIFHGMSYRPEGSIVESESMTQYGDGTLRYFSEDCPICKK